MSRKRILIVDDEANVGSSLKESLELLGHRYDVMHVESGEAALAEMSKQSFELMVTDLRMPGMNGLDLLSQALKVAPDTRTILMTAYGDDEVENASKSLNTSYYLVKPFELDTFTAAVQDTLNDQTVTVTDSFYLSDDRLGRTTQRLVDLRFEVGAQCILLVDVEGQLLAEVGLVDGLSLTTVGKLMGGGLTASSEIAQHLREGQAFNLIYHEGVRYDIYAANVSKTLFLTLIFDRRQGASRIGMVWLYTKRAIQDLLDVISTAS